MCMSSFKKDSDGEVLYDTDWYEGEDFFTKQPIREGWALVSKDVIPDSTSKNYLDQTFELYNYLKETDSLTEDETAELTSVKEEELRKLIKDDWQAAAKALSELKINQNHRRNPAEALYDFGVRYKNTNERQLETMYDWTNALTSGGRLVGFGGAGSGGAYLSDWSPRISDSDFGVVSVR